ncbi:CASP-like protein POPTRDRAFT_798217 [Striga asiatica]|uniref:CASP-like protein n=1 Tax=Striga asiatica TaxID=4170 RepID=A0A5A7PVY0_STRAF|nr:CASP-like protein POPTRDRAFT_798217 [Striga asiatica]
MASEGGEKSDFNENHKGQSRSSRVDLVIMLLRLLAFLSTLSATLVMALNKQTKAITVATIGTVPVKATLTANFRHNPAFVFFVIANGKASLHNLLMLAFGFVGHKCGLSGIASFAIPVLDLMNVAIVSGGASSAAFMGQLGRHGNSHARWSKICDKFDRFCDQAGLAMIASFVGLLLMIIICSVFIFKLRANNHWNMKLVVVP